MFLIEPYWQGGTIRGELHALALSIVGGAVMLLLLARTEPGAKFGTQFLRYLFALIGGTAANVILTWAFWALKLPIMNGTIRRDLMAENYWLGPSILVYAVVVWLSYRGSLRREKIHAAKNI
ncbi:hypothetical protein BamIOP4010DRAFT_0644 [Burkholderia ambifaria IOP40-10]|uniref:Uncharacterized protein n=1 Tax=Burkholderia ambifaria IOP40-10 TaxID=396596 RepID=B1F9D5_9BURK|nr:hypothetical protein [Burkholderia ambifaria]EDT05907.1 hypothetical protein BamIOP4010DRAFT_0644 [Burkholderia ambifaria IOP40-10]